MRILRIILFVLFLLLIPAAGASAQDAIKIEALDQPIESESIGDFISRFYNTAVGIAGIAAVLMIVVGAIYFTISGAMDKKKEGKDIITSAIWGIVILLGATLILKTINPQILSLVEQGAPAAGPEARLGKVGIKGKVVEKTGNEELGNEELMKQCKNTYTSCQAAFSPFYNGTKYVLNEETRIYSFYPRNYVEIHSQYQYVDPNIIHTFQEKVKQGTELFPRIAIHKKSIYKNSKQILCTSAGWKEPEEEQKHYLPDNGSSILSMPVGQSADEIDERCRALVIFATATTTATTTDSKK